MKEFDFFGEMLFEEAKYYLEIAMNAGLPRAIAKFKQYKADYEIEIEK